MEPPLNDKETVHHTCLVVIAAGLLGRVYDFLRNDRAIRFGNLPLLQLAGDHLLDLILQAQCDFRNFLGRKRRWRKIAAMGR